MEFIRDCLITFGKGLVGYILIVIAILFIAVVFESLLRLI